MEFRLAVPPNTDNAFLREVDEELRRDELANAWRRYGVALVAAIVAGLAVFGGWLYWQHRTADQAGAQGEQLLAAYEKLGTDDLAKAQPALAELAQSRSDGYRAMARFTQADLLLKNKDNKGAAARFAEIAADGSVAQPFRDLALVRQTSAEFDTLKPQVVVDRLRSLAVKGNPWFGSAGELVGTAYIQMNRADVARTLFGQMASDEQVPNSIRQRAIQMATAIGASGPEEKKAR